MPLLPSLASIALALTMAVGEPYTFQFASQTDQNGTAYVIVNAHVDGNVSITVEGDDGTRVSRTMRLRAGRMTKIKWKQKGKNTHYKMHISAGDADTDFEFDTRLARAGGKPSVTMTASREQIVDQHKISYKTQFVISKYLFQVFNPAGDIVHEVEKDDEFINVGETIDLSWDSADELFLVYFKAQDDVGRFVEDRRVPWSVTIPHTEVNFDSGKWDIKANEAPKVDDAFAVLVHELDGLERANAALGPNFKDKITASLYIVGYTDTVGNAGDNQVLSMNRAKEIAQYFKDKGTWCSIYYQGMGERGLAVKTPDSTDEVRNRRALYLLMPDPSKPPAGGKIPGQWKKLTDATPRTLQALPKLPDSYYEFKKKQREERERKFGKGDGEGTGGDDDSTDIGDFQLGDDANGIIGDGGGDDDESDGDGPDPIDGDAGSATGKGCSITDVEDAAPVGVAVLLALMGLGRRRRARD